MTASTFYRVTIGSDEYTKSISDTPSGPVADYRVTKVNKSGKKVSSRLNPAVHRYAISKVEAAIQRQSA